MTRCKFKCMSRREFQGWGGEVKTLFDYEFTAVMNNSEENKKFWEFTPSGKLNVSSVRDGEFIVGKEYYLDISEAT